MVNYLKFCVNCTSADVAWPVLISKNKNPITISGKVNKKTSKSINRKVCYSVEVAADCRNGYVQMITNVKMKEGGSASADTVVKTSDVQLKFYDNISIQKNLHSFVRI